MTTRGGLAAAAVRLEHSRPRVDGERDDHDLVVSGGRDVSHDRVDRGGVRVLVDVDEGDPPACEQRAAAADVVARDGVGDRFPEVHLPIIAAASDIRIWQLRTKLHDHLHALAGDREAATSGPTEMIDP